MTRVPSCGRRVHLVVVMLAFDLETTGLDPLSDTVTCAAVFDPASGVERVFLFPLGDDPEEFMRCLDEAPRICAFNGARFDLPFIEHAFHPDQERLARWRAKLHDVYEGCKLALGVTFSLQALLELNGLPGKTGDGCEAIVLAREHRWRELGEYCLNDTLITHRVSSLDTILLPWTQGVVMDSMGNFSVVLAT